jgi:hypothetical protein
MRVSPSGLTLNWNSPGVGPDVRSVSMPWLSSNAATTLASMSECVLKMTVSSE